MQVYALEVTYIIIRNGSMQVPLPIITLLVFRKSQMLTLFQNMVISTIFWENLKKHEIEIKLIHIS
jgi:hypothetical protein